MTDPHSETQTPGKTLHDGVEGCGRGIVDGSRPEPWSPAQLRLAAVLGVSQCSDCGLTSELHKDGICPGQPRPPVDISWLLVPCDYCGLTADDLVEQARHWHGPFERLWRSLSRRRRRA